ncbi:MAG: hypothetical protein NTX11_03015 [Candidatus Saccharibacteria bacterium]|nr:hypothetical protein [Candidatus Saccharibacteria bacterium]
MKSLEETNSPYGGADRIPCEIWSHEITDAEAQDILLTMNSIGRITHEARAAKGIPGYSPGGYIDMFSPDGQAKRSVVK